MIDVNIQENRNIDIVALCTLRKKHGFESGQSSQDISGEWNYH
jgi:hypothetical protein